MTEQNDIIEKLLQLRDEANQILTEALILRDKAIVMKHKFYTAGLAAQAEEMKHANKEE